MHPFSYTSLKMIHDQKIQEALEQHRLYAGQETQRQGLLQTFGKFLARFTGGHRCEWCGEPAESYVTALGGTHHNQGGFFCRSCSETFCAIIANALEASPR